jgi:hypothetical protein
VTPPIIAQLTVRDPSGNSVVPYVCSVLSHQAYRHFLLSVIFDVATARLRFDHFFLGAFFIYVIWPSSEAELPFLIAHLSLFSEDGRIPLNMGSEIGCGSAPPLLYGNLVSSVNQLEDPQGNLGLYFLFPDVSIRWRGRYQLGMTLTSISA